MHVSCSVISAAILLAGQSQSAPILGLDDGLLSTNLQLLGGLTHTIEGVPVAGQLTNGLLGVSNDGTSAGLLTTHGPDGGSKLAEVLEASKPDSLVEGSKSGGLLTVSGKDGSDSLLDTHGLFGKSTLRKRFSLPLIGEVAVFDGFTTKAKSMASDLGSKLSGILRKRSTQPLPSPTSLLSNLPVVGYIPGMPALPAISSLPVVRNIPGLALIPGLGTTSAASGIGAAVNSIASVHRSATEAALDAPMNTINTGINSAFLGAVGAVSGAPAAVDSLLNKPKA
ncbi:hypothetical protein PGT21_033180 [Puccinia graminis f. sp. tritici]|uniref:Uncharacterized protein n=2 Tax=Puccinia graminis f. sp. tritici TaxID=56615 RepID=E3KAP4_PUCGT|nr:uncharacterized protein PGTG_07072 [Puccinia graminis f. sp. tritici CRL 75-36-700-3]KAA1083631.1 hypothetical protein PGT21_001900 [Puccinia graminis f. sp. tritici]EFP81451.1 hypothetical protein PGTG_07072 [Puccinia graminis f. sp. tritici CRL 75-36-700-3]KAA1109105.1 hypothetical protein PGT21_033180 [Puccinia graminis f. sp. tritici]KAA1123396.1 hypothetical protein PGTUg99_019742 [Puccinia graminis f. sp. tritici]KAA1133193.1 hypothetical protein PGTUg99_025655 [Puccinia graminis f. s